MSQNSDQYQLPTSPSSTKQFSLTRPSSDFHTTSSTIQNDSSSPIVNDVCAGNQNGVRNGSTALKIPPNGNHCNDKYAFTLEFAPPVVKTRKDSKRYKESQLYPFDMTANDDHEEQEDLHSPFELDVPLCDNPSLKKIQNDFLIDRMLKDEMNSNYTSQQQRSPNQSSYTNVLNHASPLLTPSSDHHDIDALSDAGTYIIEDDLDIAHDDEPEQDLEQQQQKDPPEQKPSSTFKRYTKTRKDRQGTFDIHALSSPSTTTTAAHAVNRPIVDLNIPTHDLCSSSSSSSVNLSSSSSLLSLPTESDNSIRIEPEGASHYMIDDKSSTGLIYARQRPNSLSQQPMQSGIPPQNQPKAAECFVISPTFETKPFSSLTNAALRRKIDAQYKSKPTTPAVPTKDTSIGMPSKKPPPSPPLSHRSNQNDTEKYSFRLQQARLHETKQQTPPPVSNQRSSLQNSDYTPSSLKSSSTRPHTSTNDQTYSSPFQRNASIRQTMPASTQHNRPLSSSTTNKYLDDSEEVVSTHPSLTKVYMNKSFALRRQRSNLVPSTSKPVQPPPPPPPSSQLQQTLSKGLTTRPLSKPTTTIPSATASSLSTNNSTGQTNRAVELRRARAQAKIEELAQRTRQQLQKTEHHNDIMSASWHSNASSSSKKDFVQLRSNPRSANNTHQQQLPSQKQDLSKTRTISSSSHHRSSSASPNPLGEPTPRTSKHRKQMTSSVIEESQYQRMNGSTYSESGRSDCLRDDGQRLAIKLIQLSSGILAKLKPANTPTDDDSNIRELEQLVDQLQTVNRTLSNIDASLNDPTSDEPFP